MDRYVCIHGHFYQPPRENPWLEAIELQDSAHPYHDWNERITAECYAPNSSSRILDGEKHILDIVSNYAKISFNFGPTLLSWMKENAAGIYQAILEADRQSVVCRSGHGNAIAQAYNHMIMPLANTRDKRTQIIWGKRDFENRFGRVPEGMWLPETAVDMETLDLLAEQGIRFTALAQRQAARVRNIGADTWDDVSGERIDPSQAYLCRLPSGRKINLFFYDGMISRAVAFEQLLNRGEDYAGRLLNGLSNERPWPQLLNIATDGETYGHHHKYGDMALAFAIHYIESNKLAQLTNYGEYLERRPPTREVEIFDNSSWSCIHGIERWKGNCGCNSGGYPRWNQEWRAPLRNALDWLRDQLIAEYESKSPEFLASPWEARDDYIEIILNRTDENVDTFLKHHAVRELNEHEKVMVLTLLEIQRHAMLMYSSCGWFFDEISGLETVQILQYAGRAIQLSENTFHGKLEATFLEILAGAKSNIPEHVDGDHIYNKFVKPAMIDLKKVGAHYAISSLFEDYPRKTRIYSYTVTQEDYQKTKAGTKGIAIGKIGIVSEITRQKELISFTVLHLGNHDFNGGVRAFLGDEPYTTMKNEMASAFEKGAFVDVVRLMDKHFGMHNYSLKDLFKDEQRKILRIVGTSAMKEFETSYRQMYENNRITMSFQQDSGVPVPRVFSMAAEFSLNHDLKTEIDNGSDVEKIRQVINAMAKWKADIDEVNVEFTLRHKIETAITEFEGNPSNIHLLRMLINKLNVSALLPFETNLWQAQNIYYRMSKTTYTDFQVKAASGDADATHWTELFKQLGQRLLFNVEAVLKQ